VGSRPSHRRLRATISATLVNESWQDRDAGPSPNFRDERAPMGQGDGASMPVRTRTSARPLLLKVALPVRFELVIWIVLCGDTTAASPCGSCLHSLSAPRDCVEPPDLPEASRSRPCGRRVPFRDRLRARVPAMACRFVTVHIKPLLGRSSFPKRGINASLLRSVPLSVGCCRAIRRRPGRPVRAAFRRFRTCILGRRAGPRFPPPSAQRRS